MKIFIIVGTIILIPLSLAHSASDYYLKIDGVEGETTKSTTSIVYQSGSGSVGQTFVLDGSKSQDDGTVGRYSWKQLGGPIVRLSSATALKPTFTPTQAGTYVFELSVTDSTGKTYIAQNSKFLVGDGTTNTTTVTKPTPTPLEGKVEMQWKVEEGEKLEATGVEPDEIDLKAEDEPLTPDFSILLGDGSDDDEESKENREELAEILKQGMAEEGKPVETLSLNFEKVKIQVKQKVKLFGFVSTPATVTIDITPDQNVKVKFPWWAFLASDKNSDDLGKNIFNTLSNVLKTKHDTIKNSINNVR